MSGPHGHSLHFHGHSPVHRLPPQLKIAAALAFVVAVVATPREAVWAFALHLLALVAVVLVAAVPPGFLARRMVVEVPFVLLAVTMPFIATGPTRPVGPFALSVAGLWAGWALFAKGSLGALTALLLAATTEAPDIVRGLARLRLPAQLVLIMSFMIRYTEVIAGELRRMRVARLSRGHTATGLRAWPVLASTAGALFVRSYERGERVHLAMLSRGFTGDVDLGEGGGVALSSLLTAALLPLVGGVVALVAWLVRVGG